MGLEGIAHFTHGKQKRIPEGGGTATESKRDSLEGNACEELSQKIGVRGRTPLVFAKLNLE